MIEIDHQGLKYLAGPATGLQLKNFINENDVIAFENKETKEIYDLHSYIHSPAAVSPIFKNSEKGLILLKSSIALILASCVKGELVDIKIQDEDFVCKFKTDDTISENDFEELHKKIITKINANKKFEKNTLSLEESEEIDNDFFVKKAINGPNHWYIFDNVSLISRLPFLLNSQSCSKHFTIKAVAEEEFEGYDFKVQSITCSAFWDKESLTNYINQQNERKKNDHRVIGKNMELFDSIKEAAGSVFWLKNGYKLYRNLENFIRKHSLYNYNEVKTPLVMSSVFWEKSGHMAVFKQNMMHVKMGETEETAAIKPMNCPGHIEIYKKTVQSYKDLPFRVGEFGNCHRYEPSGALHGLMRVRSFTIDDGHIFCSQEQIFEEVKNFLSNAIKVYKKLGFDDVEIILSTRPEKYLGDIEKWNFSEEILQKSLKNLGYNYEIAEGEGAFYGPKIEMHVKDVMNRKWQLGTIQLDFVLPTRFEIQYDNEEGKKQEPVMLHRAVLGSLERFIAVLIEHTKGHLPVFLAPVQVSVCTVADEYIEYAENVANGFEDLGFSILKKFDNSTLSSKIRESKVKKIPLLVVIGKKEAAAQIVKIEYKGKEYSYNLEQLSELFKIDDFKLA